MLILNSTNHPRYHLKILFFPALIEFSINIHLLAITSINRLESYKHLNELKVAGLRMQLNLLQTKALMLQPRSSVF